MNNIKVKVAVNDTEFVGLKIKNNSAKIIFPIGYNIEEKEYNVKNNELNNITDDIKYLMKVLENIPTEYYEQGTIKFNFSSAIKIIDNYLKYGLYKEKDDFIKLNGNGCINWKETIIYTKPTLWNNSLIYLDYYTNSSNDIESVITDIQKYCINYSYRVLWWMYGNDEKVIIPQSNKKMDVEYMLFELNRKLMKVNDDYSKKVICNMLDFLHGTQNVQISEDEEICIGRRYFDKIWERQLRTQIYSMYEKYDDAYPTTYYVLHGEEKITNRSLIPDIVFKKDDYLIIVDAKYYSIGNLPQSSDICKQIFYGKYLRKKNKKIINIFVLPDKLKGKFDIKGYALAEGFGEENKIDLCYIDTRAVLKDKIAIKELICNIIERKN